MATTHPTARPFITRLRRATGGAHDRLEGILDLETISRSRDHYLQILSRFWGIWDPLEGLLRTSSLDEYKELKLADRFRARLLLDDIGKVARGSTGVPALPRCPLPWTQITVPQGAGILYVLEGSRLGGKLILSGIKSKLGITDSSGGAFFASAGSDPIKMWRSYQLWAEHQIPATQMEEAATAARQTFDTLITWFEPLPAE